MVKKIKGIYTEVIKMLYDMHTHTNFSHDSKAEPEDNCLAAIEKGLGGIAFTDHADMWYYNERHTLEHIVSSTSRAAELGAKYSGKLKVFRGIEVADAYFDPTVTTELIERIKPDVVIGSIHCLSYKGLEDAYSQMDFSESAISREKLVGLVDRYFELVTEMAENHDFDVLAHLTCPFRYINGKYGRGLTDEEFEKPIKTILDTVIRRKIALEVNTSGMGTALNDTMPSERIIGWYRQLGGELITLGSDAHSADRVANGFDITREMLLRQGFTHGVYYENRKAVEYEL